MASRIERVVDQPIKSRVKRVITLNVPARTTEVQVVLDRTKFAGVTERLKTICRVEIYAGKHYCGGVEWGGGRSVNDARPTPQMLWSFARWPLQKARQIRVELTAHRDFICRLDVDFF